MEYIVWAIVIYGVYRLFFGGKTSSGSSASYSAETPFERELYKKMSNRDPGCSYCGRNGVASGQPCPRTCAEVRHIYKKYGM